MSSRVNILLVEPNTEHADQIRNALHLRIPTARVAAVDSERLALDVLNHISFDFIVVDLASAGGRNTEAIQILRARTGAFIIALGLDSSEETARNVLGAGADELLAREGSFHVVIPRLIQQRIRGMDAEEDQSHTRQVSSELTQALAEILSIANTVDQNHRDNNELCCQTRKLRSAALRVKSTLRKLVIRHGQTTETIDV